MSVTLPTDLLAFMRRGVSVNVASRDAAMRPSLMRAVGSDVSEDGQRITVYLARSQSAQLLRDIASTGCVSVVFSRTGLAPQRAAEGFGGATANLQQTLSGGGA